MELQQIFETTKEQRVEFTHQLIERLNAGELDPLKTHLQVKALEKEKEQIIEAWIATDNKLQRLAAEEYYNQTFNQK